MRLPLDCIFYNINKVKQSIRFNLVAKDIILKGILLALIAIFHPAFYLKQEEEKNVCIFKKMPFENFIHLYNTEYPGYPGLGSGLLSGLSFTINRTK